MLAHRPRPLFLTALAWLLAAAAAPAADDALFTRTEDVIYGRKFGTALTLDVLRPTKGANGAGVIWVVSGGWRSNHESIKPGELLVAEFLRRGYTVFAVVHGSQPKFTIPEIIGDMHRAVRFIRTRAKDYQVDPERLGITGASAGGHLSLMMGTAGDQGNAKAADIVERAPSRVRAVACFFPPTDFLNFGRPGHELLSTTVQPPFRAALDYREFDEERRLFVPITDATKVREISKQVSPITHVTADDAPTLIVHGDRDTLVPLQQAELIVARFQDVKVPTKLVVKKGAGHGWPTLVLDVPVLADWFDEYLKKQP